jgi:hypothetical protein
LKLGFKNPEEMKVKIIDHIITKKEIQDFNLSIPINEEIHSLFQEKDKISDSILTFTSQKSIGYISFILLTSVFVGVRYIYYLVKWCIKTIKE